MSDWDDAQGPICPECGQEVFRMINNICYPCYDKREADKSMRRYYRRRLMEGTIRLAALKEEQLD